MTDIVKRLRGLAAERKARGSGAISTIDPNVTGWLEEAADEIERLRKALQEIADLRYDNTSAATIAQETLR